MVIDGKSVFYRGYYAMPNLATSDGTPTGGVYGFAVMGLEVLKKLKPDYVCVAWDKPKTNIRRRTDLYPQYKANRKPAPPDFYVQVPILHDLLDAFGWPLYEIDDHEADDIMGTFAVKAKEKDIETILVTSDHDVLQLVNGHVQVASLKRGLTDVELFDKSHFEAKYQMTPEQFVDFKSLKGDASDNIPGVAGIGEKGATELIKEFGSLDNIYDNLGLIKANLAKKLEAGKDMAYLTKKLVILDCDVPIKLDWKQADVTNTKPEAVAAILQKLEFRTLLRQLPDKMQVEAEVVQKHTEQGLAHNVEVTKVELPAQLESLELKPHTELVVHVWCNGAHGADLTEVLISDDAKRAYLINATKLKPENVAKALKNILEDESVPKIAHDTKAVFKAFYRLGVEITPIHHDVRMAAFLLNSLIREQGLTRLAQDAFGYEGEDLDDVPPEKRLDLSGTIAPTVWKLYNAQLGALNKIPKLAKLAREVEWPSIAVLAKMELNGIKLDGSKLRKMSTQMEGEISDIEQTIYGLAGKEFNIASPAQLADILFEELKLPTETIKKTKTGYSTAATELDKLRGKHEIIDQITKYREVTKLKSTYVDTLPDLIASDGRVHTTFSTAVAPTGRLSSHDPNLQNIPIRTEEGRKIRKAFIAEKGHTLISADYSQFELRLAAALAHDDDLIEIFNDGVDIHIRTAAQVYGIPLEDVTKEQRRHAKVINFGIMYGMSPHGLSVATGMTQKDAKIFIDRYFELRKPIREYIDKTKKEAHDQGYVETLFGRRRPTPDVKSSNWVVRAAAERAAVNMPLQGTEADLMKMAMIELDKKLPKEAKQILQIHDSILVECPDKMAKQVGDQMQDIMQKIYKLPVKLDVDVSIGKDWGAL